MTSPRLLIPLAVAFAAGTLLPLQAYVNGQLGAELGSSLLASTISFLTGTLALVVLAAAGGAFARAVRGFRERRGGLRAWHFVGGFCGAAFVALAAYSAPRIGVALLTVAAVAGQAVGGVLVDRAGLSPAGVRPITRARVAAVVVALIAVSLSLTGAPATVQVGVMVAVALSGAAVALQQAANGQLARLSGDAVVAATISFAVGSVALVVLAALSGVLEAPNGWSAPAWAWTGGLMGAVVVTSMTAIVARLGVLRLMLTIVAGQSLGALAVDLIAPARDAHVDAITVLGVVLAAAAVALTLRDTRRPARQTA